MWPIDMGSGEGQGRQNVTRVTFNCHITDIDFASSIYSIEV